MGTILRCAKYNGTFDRIIKHFKNREKEQMTRDKISPKLKVVVDNQ